MGTSTEEDLTGEVGGMEVMEVVLEEEEEVVVTLSSLVMAIRGKTVIRKKVVVRVMTRTLGKSIMK